MGRYALVSGDFSHGGKSEGRTTTVVTRKPIVVTRYCEAIAAYTDANGEPQFECEKAVHGSKVVVQAAPDLRRRQVRLQEEESRRRDFAGNHGLPDHLFSLRDGLLH